jgi:K+-transporting ATPase KdpF subunit
MTPFLYFLYTEHAFFCTNFSCKFLQWQGGEIASWRCYVRPWIFITLCRAIVGFIGFAQFMHQCGGAIMNAFAWIGAALALLLLVYLFYALFKPERF